MWSKMVQVLKDEHPRVPKDDTAGFLLHVFGAALEQEFERCCAGTTAPLFAAADVDGFAALLHEEAELSLSRTAAV